ncbi:MAG: PEP-CTERM/exosortase system-associated acyltransferase [Rhodocyclaceae bacterium]|jgi:N-acyl amino acid synthase of PEP-CTERM/exosortase system|nr:PEP-CTERM/exosortase system-associated acyltransferase [Rhodocyclaceae bacterium]
MMGLFDRFNLGSGYRKYFHVQAALTETELATVHRIRHEVYCEELGFEPVRPDRMERDEFDRHSLHCLLQTSGLPRQPVGCARLVLTDPEDPYRELPFERACRHSLDRSLVDPAHLPRGQIAEVSRLAVCARYRRRKGETHKPLSIEKVDFGSPAHPRFPYIPIGLYLGAVALALRHDIHTLFVLTEPRLARHFARLGVDIQQIGGPIEHRGLRVPSMMRVDSIIDNMRFLVKPLWRAILSQVDESLAAPPAQYPGAREHDSAAPRHAGRRQAPALHQCRQYLQDRPGGLQ